MNISSLSKSAGTPGLASALARPETEDIPEGKAAGGTHASFAAHLAGSKSSAEDDASASHMTDTGKDLPALAGNVLPDLPIAADSQPVSQTMDASLQTGDIGGAPSEASLGRGAISTAPAVLRGTELLAKAQETPAPPSGAPLSGGDINAAQDGQAHQASGQSAARGESIASLVRLAGALRMPEVSSAPAVPAQNAVVPGEIAVTVSFEPGIATAELLRSKGKTDAASLAGAGAPAARMALPEGSSGAAKPAPEVVAARESADAAIPVATIRATLEPSGIAAFASSAPVASGQPASIGTSAQPGSTEAHNLDALIERIVEARQSAAGGRVSLSVAHHEFGAVGIRLEHAAGLGLASAALTSNDPAFAPAVHAALADRAAAERHSGQAGQADHARGDQPGARGESSAHGGQPQAHDSRADANPGRAIGTAAFDEMFGGQAAAGEDIAPIDTAADDRGLFA